MATLLRSGAASPLSPWDATDGWRLGGRAQRELIFRAGLIEKTIQVRYLRQGWELQLDGQASIATGELGADAALSLTLDATRSRVTVFRSNDSEHVFMNGRSHILRHLDPLTTTAAAAAGPAGLTAPMPGRVLELLATVGGEVAKGAPLLVLEAMKIEHTIVAPGAGTLRAYRVAAGEQVSEGVELVDFVPAQA